MFRNILVAIDASPTAMTALEEAVDLARGEGARLTLISVATPPRMVFAAGPLHAPYPSQEDLVREARDVVEGAEAIVPPDVSVTSVVRTGSPASEIVKRVQEGGHDLVVIGSHRRGVVGSLLLGSVSRGVVKSSSVPVLVARRPLPGNVGVVIQPVPSAQSGHRPE